MEIMKSHWIQQMFTSNDKQPSKLKLSEFDKEKIKNIEIRETNFNGREILSYSDSSKGIVWINKKHIDNIETLKYTFFLELYNSLNMESGFNYLNDPLPSYGDFFAHNIIIYSDGASALQPLPAAVKRRLNISPPLSPFKKTHKQP